MPRLRSVALYACALLLGSGLLAPPALARRQEDRSPLFIYLHVLQPLEAQGAEAREAGESAVAYRLYLRALRRYQALDHEAGDWRGVRPQGLQQLVRAGLVRCETAVTELRPEAEKDDRLLQRLNQMVNLDVKEMHLRDVAKLLTTLTDVNVVVDDTLFPVPGPDPTVTLRVDRDVPLLQVIRLLVQQKGLAYAIEEDYVYISTRTRIDDGAGFRSSAWFRSD